MLRRLMVRMKFHERLAVLSNVQNESFAAGELQQISFHRVVRPSERSDRKFARERSR
jgi:hypothetical protein